jgi:hypothetical protein
VYNGHSMICAKSSIWEDVSKHQALTLDTKNTTDDLSSSRYHTSMTSGHRFIAKYKDRSPTRSKKNVISDI